MRKVLPLFAFVFLLVTSFKYISDEPTLATSNSKIENFKWLIGTWKNKTPRGLIYETWKVKNSSELSGRSYALNGSDTITFETVSLVEKDGEVHYIPSVRDQNEGNPVAFKSTFISGSKFIVENREHDFPQIISYTRIGRDQLVAEISGPTKDGALTYRTFAMNRIPDQISKNVDLVKSVFALFNEHNWGIMASLYADPAEFKDPAFGMDPVHQSRKEIVSKYTGFDKMSPDIKDEIVAIYPSGENHVIVEFVSSGTATNGLKWKLPLVSIFTIENNEIVKEFTYYDNP